MIKKLHNYAISEADIKAILRQRALLASRSPLPTSSNSCTVPAHLYIAWSDSSTPYISFPEVLKQQQIAKSVRIVNEQQSMAKEYAARVVPFEKPFPKDETPYQPAIPKDVPRLRKLRK
ncbi:hypothetical protein [Persicitalea sp.]|uniref:hypothetical protein n=1 Tax=Persicitalea sp. TaxID=3100273 RepID=UPI00359477DD